MLTSKKLNREDYKPLYAQLTEILLEYIREKNLQPGDPMPSQNELIEQYQVSQITVRQALQRLTTEGVIRKVQGKGTFVTEPKIRQEVDTLISLETRFAQEGIVIENTLLEALLVYPTQIYYRELRLPPGSQAFRVRRLKRIKGEVLGLETRLFPPNFRDTLSKEGLSNEGLIDILKKHPETEVHRIEYRTRAAAVLELEAEMLGVSPGSSVLVHHGVFYNQQNKPVMAGRIVYVADKLELSYEVRSRSDHDFRLRPEGG
jgi:GntR family transcriptional regulator